MEESYKLFIIMTLFGAADQQPQMRKKPRHQCSHTKNKKQFNFKENLVRSSN